jgi:hypothetical protein
MWRRLLRVAHPDTGGEHDLFIWVQSLHDHVAGDVVEEPPPRESPRHHAKQTERVDFRRAFDTFDSHWSLTRAIVALLPDMEEPYASVLRLLADCYASAPTDTTMQRAENQGASYKQLAYIGHLVGMDGAQRTYFYGIAEGLPLSQRHAGHILSKLQRQAA